MLVGSKSGAQNAILLIVTVACLVQFLLSQTEGRSARAQTQAATSQEKKEGAQNAIV